MAAVLTTKATSMATSAMPPVGTTMAAITMDPTAKDLCEATDTDEGTQQGQSSSEEAAVVGWPPSVAVARRPETVGAITRSLCGGDGSVLQAATERLHAPAGRVVVRGGRWGLLSGVAERMDSGFGL